MSTFYAILVFVHILAACAWIGGGFVMEVMGLRLGATPNTERMKQFFDVAHYVSPRVFMPAAILTLISGLTLVFMGGALFRDRWIIIALTGVVLTLVIGATQIGPNVARMKALLDSNGDSAEINRVGARLTFVTRLDLFILVVVLFDMVVKP